MATSRRSVLAVAAAVGSAWIGETVQAMPGMGGRIPKPNRGDVDAAMNWLERHYESIGEVMDFSQAQRDVWRDYLKVRLSSTQEHLEWMTEHPIPIGVNRQLRTEHAVALLELRVQLMRRVQKARQMLVDTLTSRQVKMLDQFEPHGGMTACISAGAVVGPKGSHPGMMRKFAYANS